MIRARASLILAQRLEILAHHCLSTLYDFSKSNGVLATNVKTKYDLTCVLKKFYSLSPTHHENKVKRKLLNKVSFFACANCLLAILVNYIPTGLLKYNESPSEIIETRYSFVTSDTVVGDKNTCRKVFLHKIEPQPREHSSAKL